MADNSLARAALGGATHLLATDAATRVGATPSDSWQAGTSDWMQSDPDATAAIDVQALFKEARGATDAAGTTPVSPTGDSAVSPTPTPGAPRGERPPTERPKKQPPRRRRGRRTTPPKSTQPSRPDARQRPVAPLDRKAKKARTRARRLARPPRWRGGILPRSILGMTMLILAFGLGVAAAGTGLFFKYQYRQDTTDARVKNFDKKVDNSLEVIRAEATNARGAIQSELEPLRKFAATGETLEKLADKAAPSTFTVRTFDVNGAPTIGTAFVVASDAQKSFLLTSYAVVQAATAKPGPDVLVRKGDDERKAQLWTWDENRDLALLIIDKGNLPRLDWAPSSSARLGQQVFALSGLSSRGASITQGFVADTANYGVQHTAPVGTAWQGGPLLNGDGKVVGVASRRYAPLGFVSDGVFFAPPIAAACEKVLTCPGGKVAGAGTQR